MLAKLILNKLKFSIKGLRYVRCRPQDLFGLQIPVTTGGFEPEISCIRSSYWNLLTYNRVADELSNYFT